MSKLVIITGVSGTGKSTLAKKIYEEIENSILLSLDTIIENTYDTLGFKDKIEKKAEREIAIEFCIKMLEEALKQKKEIIIIEYPFKIKWKEIFEKLINKYQCEVCTINVFAKDFDTIWQRLLKRENSSERHPSHYLSSYNAKKRNEYIPYFEFKYNTHKKEYEELISNSINLGKVINVKDVQDLNLKELIENIIE